MGCELEEKGTKKSSIFDQINRLQCTKNETDNFVVDMKNFSHLNNKDVTPNSRIFLKRGLASKGSQKGGDSCIIDHKGKTSVVDTSLSRGPSTLEKPMVVEVGPTDPRIDQQIHHQITMATENLGTTTAAITTALTTTRLGSKRSSFRRSSLAWSIDPWSVFLLCCILSIVGAVIVIYFTLSMEKLGVE